MNKGITSISQALKATLTAPVKLAIQVGAFGVGAGLSAAGGAVAATGAHVNRAAKRIGNLAINREMTSVLKNMPSVLGIVLHEACQIPFAVTANAFLDGVAGGWHASSLAKEKVTGKWNARSTRTPQLEMGDGQGVSRSNEKGSSKGLPPRVTWSQKTDDDRLGDEHRIAVSSQVGAAGKPLVDEHENHAVL